MDLASCISEVLSADGTKPSVYLYVCVALGPTFLVDDKTLESRMLQSAYDSKKWQIADFATTDHQSWLDGFACGMRAVCEMCCWALTRDQLSRDCT